MKNLAASHISARQKTLSELINSAPEPGQQQYVNVKISLINNAIVFPLPSNFQIEVFCGQISEFVNSDLKKEAALEAIGPDIFMLQFSPIGLGLMKKAIVFMLLDQHLYVNIVPVKEIENANYREGAISGLLSSGKSDKIYEYVESCIMSLHAALPSPPLPASYGRYFYTTSLGLSTIFASHLEPGERILAKLDIYKIERSKSNSTTQPSGTDEAFYLCTTHGSYLMVIDDSLQEKYIETLTGQEMKVTSKLGRDLVTCGSSQWLCNRDNNKLFAEVAPICNLPAQQKLAAFARLQFNSASSPADKMCAARLLEALAEMEPTPFAHLLAAIAEYSASLQSPGQERIQSAKKLMECANSMLSETGLEPRAMEFIGQYQFSAQEIMSLIFVISRAKYRPENPEAFAKLLDLLREKYFKADSNSINRGLACLSIAKKLNMAGAREQAFKNAGSAFDLFGCNPAAMLSPGKDLLPDSQFSGDALSYSALAELLKASSTESDKLKYSLEMLMMKPLIKSNFDNVLKYSKDGMLNSRLACAMAMFDPSAMQQASLAQDSGIEGNFGKMSGYMPKCTQWREDYSGLDSWLKKSVPDKTFSSIKGHGILVDSSNYHFLHELCSQLGDFFGLPGVDIYVFAKRSQGIAACDDGEGKYIFVDGELLDIGCPCYMNGSELTFALAREYAALKLGIARLSCHAQWRSFSDLGAQSLDAVKAFAGAPDFIAGCLERYNGILDWSALISKPGYFLFDVEDTEAAAGLLLETAAAVLDNGKNRPAGLLEREYTALSRLTALIADRVALMMSGNIAAAIKAIIRADAQMRQREPMDRETSVAQYVCRLSAEGRPENADLAYRISSLVSFYVSDDYKKY